MRAYSVDGLPARRCGGATASSRTASPSSSPAPSLPHSARVPGVDRVWPNVRYHSLARSRGGPEQIGADKLWGAEPRDCRQRHEDRDHRRRAAGDASVLQRGRLRYPPGFPKGQTSATTPKVIVQRTFAPRLGDVPVRERTRSTRRSRSTRRTSRGSPPATTTAQAGAQVISGVAPNAYLGNYKALTIPTPDFGLDGNSAEIAAAIEAAVADGMNVINLSLGEPEVEPTRDIVVAAIDARGRSRRRTGGRGGQRLRRVRLRLGLLARQRARPRSPSPP